MKHDNAKTTIRIIGKLYTIACSVEEQQELESASELLNQIIDQTRLDNQSSALSDERLLAMTALNIAQRLHREQKHHREEEQIIVRRICATSRNLDKKITGISSSGSGKSFGIVL